MNSQCMSWARAGKWTLFSLLCSQLLIRTFSLSRCGLFSPAYQEFLQWCQQDVLLHDSAPTGSCSPLQMPITSGKVPTNVRLGCRLEVLLMPLLKFLHLLEMLIDLRETLSDLYYFVGDKGHHKGHKWTTRWRGPEITKCKSRCLGSWMHQPLAHECVCWWRSSSDPVLQGYLWIFLHKDVIGSNSISSPPSPSQRMRVGLKVPNFQSWLGPFGDQSSFRSP